MGKKSTKKKKKDKSKKEGKSSLGKGLSQRLEKAVKQHGAEVVTELVTALIAAYVGSRKKKKTEAKLVQAAKAAIGEEADAAIETIHRKSQAANELSSDAAKNTSDTPDAVLLVKVEISDQSSPVSPVAEEPPASPAQEDHSAQTTSDIPREHEKQQA